MDLIKEKRKVRREWQQTRNPEIKTTLNRLTHTITQELDAYRINNYRKLIEGFEGSDPGLWKTTRKITRTFEEIPTLIVNETPVFSDEDKANTFAEYLEECFQPNINKENIRHITTIQQYNESHLLTSTLTENDRISLQELKAEIANLTSKKSPGLDQIPNKVIKHLPEKLLIHITGIFNRCLEIGYFPVVWKKAQILMFRKPHKNNTDPANYRPISLLSSLSKLFERIINHRLQEEISLLKIIPNIQYGFRGGHSTVHQLARVAEYIEEGFEAKKFTAAVSLDVARAFDTVWIEGLKYKLYQTGLSNYLLAILFSFLEERTFSVTINGYSSSTRRILAGVPQGSSLSPALFNIFMHDIPTDVNFEMAMFADDMLIMGQNDILIDAIETLQRSVDKIQKWLSKWAIMLNASKCQSKIFSLRPYRNAPYIIINDQEIQWKAKDDAMKYLGVLLDHRLTWKLHINSKVNQGYARLRQLYPLINRKSPLRTECTLLLYKALIRPLVTYACPVWSNSSTSNMRKIQTLQNKLLRISVNAPWFVRNEELHKDLNVPTIREFIRKLTKNFFNNLSKCSSAVQHQVGRHQIHTRLKRKLPQDLISSDSD